MKKVLKKNTGGEVVKIDRITTAATVIPRRGHRGSCGHVACDADRRTKLKDLGNVDGKPIDVNPFWVTDGYECAAPSSVTTPQPPAGFETTPAWIAAWQMKLSAR